MVAHEQNRPPRNNPQTRTILNFIHDVGIQIVLQPIDIDTVLPGITIENGGIVFDETLPFEPGDLLHESGHLAVVPNNQLGTIGGIYGLPAEEMMSIGWSYAAALHLGLNPFARSRTRRRGLPAHVALDRRVNNMRREPRQSRTRS